MAKCSTDAYLDVYFHTVLFPAMLLGDGDKWTMLHNISSTRTFWLVQSPSLLHADVLSEYLNYEDTKFSKSRNVGYVHGSKMTTRQG